MRDKIIIPLLVMALCLLAEATAPELSAADKSPPSPKKVVRTTPRSPKQAVLQAVAKGVGPVDPKKISGTKIPMIATTYSPSLHGRPTASGVTYNHRGYVVACRGGSPYRMGTRMAVMYGNRAVVVVRGDTGGLPHGTRTRQPIDLSGAATEALGLKPGVHKVSCVILK